MKPENIIKGMFAGYASAFAIAVILGESALSLIYSLPLLIGDLTRVFVALFASIFGDFGIGVIFLLDALFLYFFGLYWLEEAIADATTGRFKPTFRKWIDGIFGFIMKAFGRRK